MSHTEPKRLRIIPELRSYHLAEAEQMLAADNYFFEGKYDLSSDEVGGRFRQISFAGFLRLILTGDHDLLEVWEPLWVRLLPKHIAIGAAWSLRRLFSASWLTSYAMENNELSLLIGGKRTVPPFVARLFSICLGVYIRTTYSQIAYASEGSRRIYQQLACVSKVPSTLIPNLPARTVDEEGKHSGVVFVARLEERKGVRQLMQAWQLVEAEDPRAYLTIVGDGPMSAEVRQWCGERPGNRRTVGALIHAKVTEVVQRNTVLVLPSIRWGRWREQIGLPIHEGLQCGLTIVATQETGLADWLHAHGHQVVDGNLRPTELAHAILESSRSPLSRSQVRESLPRLSGRVEANAWMHGASRA